MSSRFLHSAFDKAVAVALVVAMLPFWLLTRLQEDGVADDQFEPDLSEDNDRITSFEASDENLVEFRPGTDTLEDAASETTEYNVYTERRVEIDPDRLEEWVRANYDDEMRVDIETIHGTEVYSHGERVDHECPICGDSALVKTSGGQRQWVHVGRDETCTLEEVPDGQS